jgi:hypothetical protein
VFMAEQVQEGAITVTLVLRSNLLFHEGAINVVFT